MQDSSPKATQDRKWLKDTGTQEYPLHINRGIFHWSGIPRQSREPNVGHLDQKEMTLSLNQAADPIDGGNKILHNLSYHDNPFNSGTSLKLLLYVIFKCLGIESIFVFISYEMLEVNKFQILG